MTGIMSLDLKVNQNRYKCLDGEDEQSEKLTGREAGETCQWTSNIVCNMCTVLKAELCTSESDQIVRWEAEECLNQR